MSQLRIVPSIAALLLCALSPSLSQSAPGPVVVSELMWSGSSASSADEWLELYNRSDEAIHLAGFTLTRGMGADETVMLVLPEATLEPGSVFLIANYDADDERSRLQRVPDFVDAALSLPNSRLRLRLYAGSPEDAAIIDEIDDGSGAPMAGAGGDARASMVRAKLDLIGSSEEAWTTAEEAIGWDAGADELGTPGTVGTAAPEAPNATMVTELSWGRVKATGR